MTIHRDSSYDGALKQVELGTQEVCRTIKLGRRHDVNSSSPFLPDQFDYATYSHDITHLFSTLAAKYVDASCVHLHLDEIVGDTFLKFTKQLSRGYFGRCSNRQKFFAMVRTIANNHIRGLVQRYRFTSKRTGVKPPKKGELPLTQEDLRSFKPVEVSLDDEESLLQVGEENPDFSHLLEDDLVTEIRATLTPLEELVMDQLSQPNMAALIKAKNDSGIGQSVGSSVKVVVKKIHLAEGLGMDISQFLELEQAVMTKINVYMEHEKNPASLQERAKFMAAVTVLCETFDIQLPPFSDRASRGITDVDIRRCMNMAARRDPSKLTEQAKAALIQIGVRVPVSDGLSLACFGSRYNSRAQECQVCSHSEACKTETCSLGLDKVTIHPTLLGIRQARVPTMLLSEQPQMPKPSERNDTILAYLNEAFAKSVVRSDLLYRHQDVPPGVKASFIFAVVTHGDYNPDIRLRFCAPSHELSKLLEKRNSAWYLPNNVSAEKAIELIEQHAAETLEALVAKSS